MRFVVVSDVHGNVGKAERLVERLMGEDFDALLISGDITHFKGRESAEEILNVFEELGKPLLAIMGNCDGRGVLDLLEERGISVHDRRVELGEVGIVGFGGSNMTPFSTIWEFDDRAILESLSRNYRDGDVLLLHTPPYGTRTDRIYSGRHVGSKGVRNFIEEHQPPLVLCGHIHEARAVDSIGKTVIVNPGPLFRGYYATVELKEKKASVSLERI